MIRAGALALALAAFATGAAAQDGFRIEVSAATPLAPDAAWRAFTHVERWWSDAHTYGGDADALRLEAQAGGCWCERLAGGGSVEHMRVVNAQPGALLRMQGGLGPLQALPAQAVMSVTFTPDGAGTTVRMSYAVEGGGAGALAGPVKAVLEEQLARYAASAR